MLRKGFLLLVTLVTLIPQGHWSAYAIGTESYPEDTPTSPHTLPLWFLPSPSSSFSEVLQGAPGNDEYLLDQDGMRIPLPIRENGFQITIRPEASITQPIWVRVVPSTNADALSTPRDNVTFIGSPFEVEAIDAQGRHIEGFGLQPIYQEIDGSVYQIYTSTLEVIIPYNEENIRDVGCGQEVGLDLYVYNEKAGAWQRMASWVDTEKNELHVWFHTMAGNIFRLGVLDSLPTIALDPDSNVAYVYRTTVNGHTFPYVSEGPLNIATAQNVHQQIRDIADGCGNVITVELTYEAEPAPSRDTRTNRILGWNPKAAVVIAYDADTHYVRTEVPGGIKALYVDRNGNRDLALQLVSALRSYYNRTHGNSTGLYAYQSSGPSGAGYYIGSYRMHPSVETDVALERENDIPIVRVEVGLLSSYYNRLAIDSRQEVIASQIAAAIMNFLDLKIGCINCADVDEFQVFNGRYRDTDAAACVLRRLMHLTPLASPGLLTATLLTSGDDFCGLYYYGYVNTNPPLPLFVEINKQGKPIQIVQPKDAVIASIAMQMMGISDKVVVSDYYGLARWFLRDSLVATSQVSSFITSSTAISSVRLISTAISVGACTGLVSWLARKCADLEVLSQYHVNRVADLTIENQAFLEAVLWYQVAQLSDQVLDAIQAYSPTYFYQQMENLGTRNPLAPRIAVFVPDRDLTSCDEGEIPTGHTLFIVGVGQNGDDLFLQAFDPNTHEKITIDIDEARNQWIFPNAPYTLPNGTRTWRGSYIYAVPPQYIPPYPIDADEDPNISFEVLDFGAVGGYAAWFLGGYAPWFLGAATSATPAGYCIPITTAQTSAPFPLGLTSGDSLLGVPRAPSVRRFTTGTLHITYQGTLYNSNSFAETLFTPRHLLVIMGEANADTINALDLYPDLRGITITTNMTSQMISILQVRSVDQGRANRIGNIRAITLTPDAPIAFYASPHNNIFTLHNLSSHNKQINLFFGSTGSFGVTAYTPREMTIYAGHIMSFTAWNWDNLSDTLFFAYDSDGTTVTPTLLQDVVRPTHIVFGKPSYVSGTVTYLTPKTKISFDVMPATCGISATLYRLDGGTFQVYTQAFTLEGLDAGNHTIEYYSVDNAGNVEPVNQADLYLYNAPPQLSIALSGEVDSAGWYTPPVTITLIATPTVLPIGETSCQLRPDGTTLSYTRPFTVGEETSEVICTVQDVAGLETRVHTGIPIRKAQEDLFETGLGDPAIETRQHIMDTYRTIISRLYARPGTAIQAREAGLCNNVPMQPGDVHLLPDPPLGVPAETDPNCPLASAAMYGAPIGLFVTEITNTQAMWEAPVIQNFLKQDLGISEKQIITLTEADLQAGKLSENPIALLIIPAIEETFVESITARLGITGSQALRQFAAEGGYLYASGGYAASLLAKAGIISPSAITTQSLVAEDNLAPVEVLQPASPLFFNWLTTTVYVPNGDLVLTPTGNLTALAQYSGTNAQGSAAILYGRYGKGEIVIANHHPLVPQDPIWYPFAINTLLDAMDAPLALLMQAEQQFNADVPYDLLPAYEKDVPIRLTIAADYLSAISGTLQGLTVTLHPGFYFSTTENPGWEISDDGQVATLSILTSTATLTQGRHLFTLIARTASTETLNPGTVVIGHAEASLQTNGEAFEVTSESPTVRSASPPELSWKLRPSPEVLYGLEQDDIHPIEVVVGTVNQHDGAAYDDVYTTIVPLLMPILDLRMEDVVTDANGHTIWMELYPTFDIAPYPEEAWPGQRFSLRDWDGHTVITLSLPADSSIEAPFTPIGDGCDRIDGKPCCAGSGGNVQVGIIRTPTQTLVILPAMQFTWHLGNINGYEYQDPNIRYHVQVKERNGRAIRFLANYDPREPSIYEDTSSVYLRNHGAIWLNAGQAPLSVDGQPIHNPPQYAGSVGGAASDLWDRSHTEEAWAKQLFFIIPSEPEADGASVLNISAEARSDTNDDGIPEALTETIPADRPVTLCLYTTLHDYGRQMTQTAPLLLRIPVGLGYQITPIGGDWASASSFAHGYAVYSATHIVDGDYNVLYQVTLPDMADETITTCFIIQPYPGIHHEGYRPYLDGAFYFYPNDTGDEWPFSLETSFAQAAWAVQHDLSLDPTPVPWRLGHGEHTIHYVLTLQDTFEPQQVAPPIYIATSMHRDAVATTYVGGTTAEHELLDTLINDNDDIALIRIEIHNNTGITWSNLVLAATYPGLIIEPYRPTEGDIMAFSEHPHLQLPQLHGYGWGVYYFRVRLDPAQPVPRGTMLEIPFTLSGENVPEEFTIPPARIGVPEAGQSQVTTILGQAQDVHVIVHPGHEAIQVDEARITTLAAFKQWRAADRKTQAQLYATWPVLTYRVITENHTVIVDLPPLSNTIPAEDGPYVIVLKEKVGPFKAAIHRVTLDAAPTLSFTNAFRAIQQHSEAPVQADVRGPELVMNYVGLPRDTGIHAFTLQAIVRNEGDRTAIDPIVVLTMPLEITVTAQSSACQAAVPLSIHQEMTCAIADLIPGGEDHSLRFTIESKGSHAMPNLIIAQARGHYINSYTGLPESDLLGTARIPSRVYLPVIVRNYTPPYVDLTINAIEVQPQPVHVGDNPTILVTIRNNGNVPIEGPFWVDLQRDHCPEINQQPAPNSPIPWIAWEVTETLQPGGSLTLSSENADEAFKRWAPFEEARTYALCALVDSYDDIPPEAADPQGMVHESNENNNTLSITIRVTEAPANSPR